MCALRLARCPDLAPFSRGCFCRATSNRLPTFSWIGFRAHLDRHCRFASRTPMPPPFSGINSTPAFLSADSSASRVSSRPPISPSVASSRLIVGLETPERAASSCWLQPNKALAAFIWRIDTFGIDTNLSDRYFSYHSLLLGRPCIAYGPASVV
jgi:hypothetical protein